MLCSSLSLSSTDLVDLQEWHAGSYASAGSWNSWLWETVKGKDYNTRRLHFDAFVSVAERLDHTSAQIVSFALREGKTVLGFNMGAKLLSVNSLRERDDEAGGWVVSGALIQG